MKFYFLRNVYIDYETQIANLRFGEVSVVERANRVKLSVEKKYICVYFVKCIPIVFLH